jgi:predicted ATPase/DNA-binding SARP family transcriptional activator
VAAPLQVTLLGPPQVLWEGGSLLIPRRQARALLYRLAAAPQPLGRDHLGFLLWPDSPQSVARRNLTVLLAQLRRVLPLPELLESSNDMIGLDQANIHVDTLTFLRVVPRALQTGQLAQLAEAVALYRGPFLDGFALPDAFEWEAWADGERQAWERRYLDLLAALITGYSQAGDYGAAIAAAQRALAADPLAEEQHRQLIELYARSGDRVAALRQFEQCILVLERELGVGPLPPTRAVYEAIRDGQYPLQAEQPNNRTEAVLQPMRVGPVALTLAAPPTPLGALIGREQELETLRELLRAREARLLTLSGPGGTGKTRLALEVVRQAASHFADGVVFVPLAPLRDPGLVLDAIARACGIEGSGVPSASLALQVALRDRRMLIVLDNVEHLLQAAPQLTELLQALPTLQLLATSRSPLHVGGEHVFAVPPLPLPSLDELPPLLELAAQPAVALLLARTQALQPRFALTEDNARDLAAICVRLDGLPLALELAAARLRLIAPRALLKRLDHRLVLLTDGPRDLPPRQRTLREVIAWSYGLLDSAPRALFACLAVCAGSWSLEAAEELGRVTGHPALQSPSGVLDALAALVDASLVQQITSANGVGRMQMLETIREYALERLDEGSGVAPVAAAHMHYYTAQATTAARELRTPEIPATLARLDEDHANLLAALEWATKQHERSATIALMHGLLPFWCVRGYLHEGRIWIERTLPTPLDLQDKLLPASEREKLALTYLHAVELYFLQGEYAAAAPCCEASVALWRTLNNSGKLAIALITLAAAYEFAGNMAAAVGPLAEGEALAEAKGDAEAHAWLALERGRTARHRGRPREAREQLTAALAYYREQGDLWEAACIPLDLAPVLLALGDEAAAEMYAREALALARQLHSQTRIANALNELGEIARYRGDAAEAAACYTESMQLLQRVGNRSELPRLLHNLAYVALCERDVIAATDGFTRSMRLFTERQIERGVMEGLIGLGVVAVRLEQPLLAAQLWGAAEALGAHEGWELWPPDQLAYAWAVAEARAHSDHAAFDEAWQRGRAMSRAEACALADKVWLAAHARIAPPASLFDGPLAR